MTDKEIRALIEKRRKDWKYGNSVEAKYKAEECDNILELIDPMQEEPVSEVWHDMSESVENGRNIIIIDPVDFYGAVLRKGGSQLKNHNKERYVKWAYIDDILNLSNVQRTVKDWKEEPVSEELETEIEKYLNALYRNWTKKDREKDADVEEMCRKTARHFANWQKEQDQEIIELAEDHAMLAGMEKMKEQMIAKAVDATVHIDAGNYPYIPQIELYDYDKDVPLAKEGDKVKVIIIKENKDE